MDRHRVKEIYDDYILDIYGNKYYYKDNYLYKLIAKFGSVYHYNESGSFHRLDGPAIEFKNGNVSYYIDGLFYSYENWLEKVKEYE